MKLRILVAAVAAGVVGLAMASPAAAQPVQPNPGEGLIHMTARTCGSSATWRQQSVHNGLAQTGPYAHWLSKSKTYDIVCSGAPTAPAPAIVAPSSALWVHPLPGTCRPAGGGGQFGADRGDHLHQGIDLGSANTRLPGSNIYAGMPIRAIGGGVIIRASDAGNAGLQVQESIGNGQVIVKYNHLSGFAVRNGAWVNPGQTIGYMGGTGNANGNVHLHIEVWLSGRPVNPVGFLGDRGVWIGC